MRAVLLAAIASVGMVGCVGTLEQGGGAGGGGVVGGNGSGSDAARLAFNNDVYGIISGMCSGCHTNGHESNNATGFVDSVTPTQDDHKAWDTVNAYTAAVGVYTPSSADLFNNGMGKHPQTPVAVNPGMYTSDQQTKITNWLALELAWRGGSTPTGPGTMTADALLSQWSKCMTQANFDTAAMATNWGNVNTGEGRCRNCHVTGQSGMEASNVSTQMFTILDGCKACVTQFFSVDLQNQKIVVNTTNIPNVLKALAPHGSHPVCNDLNALNAAMAALQTFYTSTMTNVTAGATACTSTGF
jgi:hypothetical protein